MGEEAKRIAICGVLKWEYDPQMRRVYFVQDGDVVGFDWPSLDAIHEAEKVLTREQQDIYANNLYPMLPCDENHGPCGDGEDIMTASMFQVAHASAAQRAQAFLKTLNLWVPEKSEP